MDLIFCPCVVAPGDATSWKFSAFMKGGVSGEGGLDGASWDVDGPAWGVEGGPDMLVVARSAACVIL